MRSKQHGKRERQEGAMKRTEAQLAVYEPADTTHGIV